MGGGTLFRVKPFYFKKNASRFSALMIILYTAVHSYFQYVGQGPIVEN